MKSIVLQGWELSTGNVAVVQVSNKTFIENYFTEPHKFPTMLKFPQLLIIWPQILQTDKTASKVSEKAEEEKERKNYFYCQ